MLKVKIEEYHNDSNCHYFTQTFASLKQLQDWVMAQMRVTCVKEWIKFNTERIYFEMRPDGPGWSYKIRLIEDEDGIIFSDGQCTDGQKHIADCVKQWLNEFKQELECPKYNFVNK